MIHSVLHRHLCSCSCNAYEISELVRFDDRQECRELGGAVYPTISLSNHSCCQNTMRYNEGALGVVRASRVINIGEEITDNYGEFYQTTPKDERQER